MTTNPVDKAVDAAFPEFALTKELLVMQATLVHLLIKKGVFSEAEFEEAKALIEPLAREQMGGK